MSWYIQRALRQSLVSWILRWILPHRVLFFDWLNPFSQVSLSLDRRSFKAWHRHTQEKRIDGCMEKDSSLCYTRLLKGFPFRETELNVFDGGERGSLQGERISLFLRWHDWNIFPPQSRRHRLWEIQHSLLCYPSIPSLPFLGERRHGMACRHEKRIFSIISSPLSACDEGERFSILAHSPFPSVLFHSAIVITIDRK